MTFVYRGKGFERLADFESRILDQFPHAEPMRTMDAPTDEEKEDAKQRVQIIKVNIINIFTCSQSWNRQHHGQTIHTSHRKVYFNEFGQNSLCCDMGMIIFDLHGY